jgi:hypothetical protein
VAGPAVLRSAAVYRKIPAMHYDVRARLALPLLLGFPAAAWLLTAIHTERLSDPKLRALYRIAEQTPDKPLLLAAFAGGFVVALLILWLLGKAGGSEFRGAPFHRRLRGAEVVSAARLRNKTRTRRAAQIDVSGIPMPPELETRHLMIAGSTGTGKSVLMRAMAYSALRRGDRLIVADPNGDMLSKFGRRHDVILNPYDARSEGWSFFNEIRADYDFKRYALSIVHRGKTAEAEEWNGYARLLFAETARKLRQTGGSIQDLFRWTTIAPPKELKDFLEGTAAESLFVGADRALASARFVLSNKLPEHLSMPPGDFSLRRWLEDPKAGNLFITWREDMATSLRPLISTWIDALCTSILSMPENQPRRLWMLLDELASLENLPSLQDALTKGRKVGLRVVAGLQSTAQLDDIYGREKAQALRSCFRNLVVLGGAKTDPQTCEDMSKALGEHEVERIDHSRSHGNKGTTRNRSTKRERERIVTPSEIAGLPDLTGYVAFSGGYSVARVKLDVLNFKTNQAAFVER